MHEIVFVDNAGCTPEAVVKHRCKQIKNGETQLLCIRYSFVQYWLDNNPVLPLVALIELTSKNNHVVVQFSVTDQVDHLVTHLQAMASAELNISAICQQFLLPHFCLDQPIALSSINIPKPWGQEIWYTGIEERGVCMVSRNSFTLPLPWVLSVFPYALCANMQRALVLLKILDPLPDAVVGDLYFELHEKKREVYVVTAVDQRAWPDGVGEIRFGFNQQVRNAYSNDRQFREAFLAAVNAYEIARRKIDVQLDKYEAETGLSRPVVLDDYATQAIESYVPQQMREDEQKRRATMESFTGRRKLRVGDVVKVPCLTPHSLQHGVRTVEFQTPVYERLIVSFAQKVLTQEHWDTQRAVELMTLEAQGENDIQCLLDSDGVCIDRIVDFDDFDVKRVVIRPGAGWFLRQSGKYSLCMVINGTLIVGDTRYGPEQSVLLTHSWSGEQINNNSDTNICFLLADPK